MPMRFMRGSDSDVAPSSGVALNPALKSVWLFRPAAAALQVAAGRPDLRVHDLRHTGAVLAAQTGAISAFFWSQPSAIWRTLTIFFTEGEAWTDISFTFRSTILGFLIGTTAGSRVKGCRARRRRA